MHSGATLREYVKQAGHTLRHPGSAAAETAGRIMGRNNDQHRYRYTPFAAAAAAVI